MCCINSHNAYNRYCQQVTKQVSQVKLKADSLISAYQLYIYIRACAFKCQQVSQLIVKEVEVNYMPIEEALEETKKEVERKIKFALLDRGMTQKQLSDLINENRQQVNRAIKGDTTPKSKEIRNKIYQLFNIKGMK